MELKSLRLPFALMLTVILIGCGSSKEEVDPLEFLRPGALSSLSTEGPHLIYNDEHALILNGKDVDGEMLLVIDTLPSESLTSIKVYKSGYLPRLFEVELMDSIQYPASVYPEVSKIFAVSDIEGNFNALVNLLQQHDVIDIDLNWNFGDGHFVMVGDVFDRGNHTTEMLWLLYRLEYQAAEQGGQMHLLLGNHEAMNLRGDLRYLESKYTTFAELAEVQAGIKYSQLYDENAELGRWLRSKNVVERIGDKLFVHAGISPVLVRSGYDLDQINTISQAMLKKAKPDFNTEDSLMWGKNGPFWYRGYFDVNRESWGPKASQAEVDAALARFDASSVIVGHTHVEKPEFLYGGRVCAIDVVPPADHLIYAPPMQAYGLLIQEGEFYRADEDGRLTRMSQ